MKTVTDAVRQENGKWREEGYNAMAWLLGGIDYCSVDGSGNLHHGPDDRLNDPMPPSWQLVCTRAQFEAEAERLGYRGVNRVGSSENLNDTGDWKKQWRGHEDGLPPVGTVCEMRTDDGWGPTMILARDGEWVWAKELRKSKPLTIKQAQRFRPIKTDRERWIESAEEVCGGMVDLDPILEAIWDNGLAKLP